MGSCFSSKAIGETHDPSIAKVISANGDLREYPIPVTVSQVIESEAIPCFLCNSDSLLYEDYIPSLNSGEELQAGQIYFVLPTSRLQCRLTAPEMAALAVKASTALSHLTFRKEVGWNYNEMGISSLLELNDNQSSGIGIGGLKNSVGKPRIE